MRTAAELLAELRGTLDWEWTKDALCATLLLGDVATGQMFYPEKGSDNSPHHSVRLHRRAKRVCAQCPVRRACLQTALSDEERRWDPLKGRWSRKLPAGVWGGHTAAERHSWTIKHYPDCNKRVKCNGCRPLDERADILEDVFRQSARTLGLLTRKERMAT